MQNVVGEYMFFSREDALLAEKEMDKISQLTEKLDMSNIDLVYKVYNKCIETRSFQTPVGLDFMRKLRMVLLESNCAPGEILPIPLFVPYDTKLREHNNTQAPKIKTGTREEFKTRDKLKISIIVNFILAALVIAMFVIADTGSNPNILNYENAIITKYAQWEEELNERERELNDREAPPAEEYR